MRFFIMASIILFQVASAQAKCEVFIPEKEFYTSDFVITFDFTKMLNAKNYTEIYSPESADFELKLQGVEQEGRFHRALAILELGSHKAQESVVCYTQYCGVSDFRKAFTKSYKKLSALIPVCQ